MSLWVLDVVEIRHHKYFPNTVHDIRFIRVIAFGVKSNVAWLSQSVHEIRRQMPIASFPSLTLIVLSKMNYMTFSYFCVPHRNINLSHHWMCSWTFIFICCFRSFPFVNALKAFNLSFQSKFYGRERQRLRILFIESFYNRHRSSKPTFTLVRGNILFLLKSHFAQVYFVLRTVFFWHGILQSLEILKLILINPCVHTHDNVF